MPSLTLGSLVYLVSVALLIEPVWLATNISSYYVEQCMAKIIEVIQPCSQRAISNWNLNHSLFVPSKLSQCCANWEVYECFIQASLENCSLLEFQAVVNNMTTDALFLQKNNCSRFKYHSEVCASFNGCLLWPESSDPLLIAFLTVLLFVIINLFS